MESKKTNPFNNTTIPSDWEVRELGKADLLVIDGDRGENYPNEEDLLSFGYCLFLNAKNVTNNGFSFIEKRFITKDKDEKLRKGKLRRFDLVLTTRGTVGNISFYDKIVPFEHLRINSGMVIIRNENKSICTEYIYKIFNSFILQDQIIKIAFGSAQPQLTVKEILKFKVPLPSLPEQRAIAQVLGLIDSAISHNNQIIAQKELRKKWLMQHLLTGKKRLKGFKGEWKECHLGEVFKERNETKYYDLPLLSVGASGIYPQSDSIKKDTSNDDKSKYKRICPGDIGYNTMRMWQGRSALSSMEGIVSPAYTIVTPKKDANSLFFSYLFKVPKLTNLFWRNSQGLVDDTLNCKFKDFAIVRVNIPKTKTEQTAIAQVLQAADKEIQLLKAKVDKLREQKKGLMQVLLTGKKRLKII